MEQFQLVGGFEYRKRLEIQGDPSNVLRIESRHKSTDPDGMIVFHRYQYSNKHSLSFADEESKVNFMRLSLMPEFPEITVKHFSIYYQTYDENTPNIHQYLESFYENQKHSKILELLESLIDLIKKVHALKVCLLKLDADKILVVDGQLKLYFPVELHASRDDFKKNYSERIEPMNGFEEDVMDFALIVLNLIGGEIKEYKGVDKNEMNSFIQALSENDERKKILAGLAFQIFTQEITYNDLNEIKETLKIKYIQEPRSFKVSPNISTS